MELLFALIFIFLASTALILRRRTSQAQTKLPPGPPKLPFIGNFHQLKLPLHKTLMALSAQYGDLMSLKLGTVPAIVISSSEVVSEICKSHDITFSSRPLLYVPWTLEYRGLGLVFSPYGQYWRNVKKMVTSELLSMKKVQSFEHLRAEEVARLVSSVTASSTSLVNLSELIHIFSNNVVCRAAFSKSINDEPHRGGRGTFELLHGLEHYLSALLISDYFPSIGWIDKLSGFSSTFEKHFKDLDEIFNEILREHRSPKREKPQETDFIDVLTRLQSADNSETFTDDLIKSLIMLVFVAGTGTSAATLVWAMSEMIRNPTVLKVAQEEVRKTLNGRDKVEEKDLREFVYLKMVIKETLRHHPVAPMILRETIESCQLKGFDIPAKTRVFVNEYAIGRDSRSWQNPEEFRPDRFSGSEVDFRGQHFELLPFGFGRRMCPGINFAITAIELVLASLLYHFDWKLPVDLNAQDLDMEEACGLIVHKKKPLLLSATTHFIDCKSQKKL